ncbi:12674_t:CDS:2 [Entrophospora sp. SA101]|nr:12674_t:CDS:2 [Entrophospora sp. SA101]
MGEGFEIDKRQAYLAKSREKISEVVRSNILVRNIVSIMEVIEEVVSKLNENDKTTKE